MKKFVLIAVLAMFGTASFNAQKLGHINVAELVQSMPETQAADQTLTTESEAKGADIQKYEDALQTKADAFQTKMSNQTEAEAKANLAANQAEYQSLQQEAQKVDELKQKAVQELQKRQEELLEPIREKAMTAIQAVANEKGLEYVIDSSSGVLVIANGPDLLPAVKAKLGIQ